jgi:hypothetical protein
MLLSSYPDKKRTWNEEPAHGSRLLLQGLHAKQQVITDLIEGRLKLLEAASRFQAAHSTTLASVAGTTMYPEKLSDSEHVCRTVIGWVHLALGNRPEEAERVSARLERELQTYLDRFGTVSLPQAC